MIVLAIDTAGTGCYAALYDSERDIVLGAAGDDIGRGHAERLMEFVDAALDAAGTDIKAVGRIAVTVGPGSFTGLRVGLAFAKGLSAALSIPAVGVGSLEALARPFSGRVLSVLDAKRGQVYLQAFADGVAVSAPDALPLETAAARVAEFAPEVMVGTGAPLLAEMHRAARIEPLDHADPLAIAMVAAARKPAPPRPLYLRAPDAKLPGGKSLSE